MVVNELIRTLAKNATNTTIDNEVFITETGAQLLILVIGIIGLLFGIYQYFIVKGVNRELAERGNYEEMGKEGHYDLVTEIS